MSKLNVHMWLAVPVPHFQRYNYMECDSNGLVMACMNTCSINFNEPFWPKWRETTRLNATTLQINYCGSTDSRFRVDTHLVWYPWVSPAGRVFLSEPLFPPPPPLLFEPSNSCCWFSKDGFMYAVPDCIARVCKPHLHTSNHSYWYTIL